MKASFLGTPPVQQESDLDTLVHDKKLSLLRGVMNDIELVCGRFFDSNSILALNEAITKTACNLEVFMSLRSVIDPNGQSTNWMVARMAQQTLRLADTFSEGNCPPTLQKFLEKIREFNSSIPTNSTASMAPSQQP